MKQQTIGKAVSAKGIGLHTGQTTSISIQPAPANHGVKFKRVDTEKHTLFMVDPNKVGSTQRSTCLKNGEVTLSTVEHLLSAIAASPVDNVLIEVDGPEIPILDGSCQEWLQLLKTAGTTEQEREKEFLVIEETLEFRDEETGASFVALPHEDFSISALLEYDTAPLNLSLIHI